MVGGVKALILLLVVVCVGCATPLTTLPTDFKSLKALSEKGDAKAQFNLGEMYQFGLGVEKDEKEAGKWYRKAAEQNVALAQYNLGVMHQFGKGVEKDEKEAVKWCRKAAEQNHALAQFSLGGMY